MTCAERGRSSISDELAEMLAHAEHAEDDLASVFADEDDLDSALADDEQRVAGIVLEENDASARIEFLARELAEALELDSVEAAEERHRGEKVGCGGGVTSMGGRRGERSLAVHATAQPRRRRREVTWIRARCQTATRCRACLLDGNRLYYQLAQNRD